MRTLDHCLRAACLAAAGLSLAACGGGGPYRLAFMPAPDIYAEEIVNPFTDDSPVEIEDGNAGILYVTNRARDPDTETVAYTSERGHVLRAGVAQIALGAGDYTWEEARRISLLKNRTEDYPLEVSTIEEFGVLPESLSPMDDPAELHPNDAATERLVQAVQAQLDRSELKDITIYVHGYKVVFDNPVLVSAELWHYLGYQGSFIAFSWPSTPARLAYFGDTATAQYSGSQLRRLITLLCDRTTAENVNIIGYSAGTRVVVNAIDQLSLQARWVTPQIRQRYLRLGHVILVGADADRDNFARIVAEGATEIVDDFEIYVSEHDKALSLSRWLLRGQNRLGQALDPETVPRAALDWLAAHPSLRIINVSEAESARVANGHGYFRQSPWVSGDILMTLRHDLAPAERGLVPSAGMPTWEFPPDYLERVRVALQQLAEPARTAAN